MRTGIGTRITSFLSLSISGQFQQTGAAILCLLTPPGTSALRRRSAAV
jgi:hypothetical protein